jgi:hypothetical protein
VLPIGVWKMQNFLFRLFSFVFSLATSLKHQESHPRHHKTPQIHIVFIGDSLLRYTYLDLAYRLHFHKSPPLNLTSNDRGGPTNQRWEDYLLYSTEIFKGSMVCDCFRSSSQNVPENITEIRYYTHPSKQIYLTFYVKFGQYPIFGKINRSEAKVYSSLEDSRLNSWNASVYRELVPHIQSLSPIPTVVILNERFWLSPFHDSEIISELPDLIRSLFQFADHILWLQGTPTLKESRTNHLEKLNPTDDFMSSILCNSSHPLALSIADSLLPASSASSSAYSSGGSTRSDNKKFCHFIPFPTQLREDMTRHGYPPTPPPSATGTALRFGGPPRSRIGSPTAAPTVIPGTAIADYYSDHYHFKNNTVYELRMRSALETIGLSDITRKGFLKKMKKQQQR